MERVDGGRRRERGRGRKLMEGRKGKGSRRKEMDERGGRRKGEGEREDRGRKMKVQSVQVVTSYFEL